MKNEIKILREAVKDAGLNAREYKKWYRRRQSLAAKGASFIDASDPNPAKVEDPSRRATLLCMVIAHARGKLHAPGYVYPAFNPAPLGISTLEAQRAHLEKSLDRMAEWEAHALKYNRPARTSLNAEERKMVRIILHEAGRVDSEETVAAVG